MARRPAEEQLRLAPDAAALPEGGTARAVTRWGEPVMHHEARPVTAFDNDLAVLVADMVATMYAADGVGLAACQIGVDAAVFVFDCPDEDHLTHRGVVCNPVLDVPAVGDRRLDEDDEGCLSYPGAFTPLARPDHAVVRGQDATGADVVFEGTGLFARCLQHETDHTHGTVFGDRLNDRSRKKLRKAMEAATEDYATDWPADV